MAQQERAIRTREAILRAAASVFDERGYEAATIGEILARSGVTKGALYFHFPSKLALAEGVLAEQITSLVIPQRVCRLQQLVDLWLLTAFRMRLDPVVSAGARLSLEGEMSAQFGPRLTGEWIAATESILVQAREQGELLPHVDIAETAWVFTASWTGVQIFSHTLVGRADLEKRVVQLFEHLLPSVAVPAVLGKLVLAPGRAAELAAESEQAAGRAASAVAG